MSTRKSKRAHVSSKTTRKDPTAAEMQRKFNDIIHDESIRGTVAHVNETKAELMVDTFLENKGFSDYKSTAIYALLLATVIGLVGKNAAAIWFGINYTYSSIVSINSFAYNLTNVFSWSSYLLNKVDKSMKPSLRVLEQKILKEEENKNVNQ